jgi:hypothetical protein
MWFTDPTDTSTITVLLVEIALPGLAVAAAFGALVRPVRWLALSLAALSALVAVLGIGVVVWELWTFRYPLVLPVAAFGTYTQPTLVGLASLVLTCVMIAVAGVLAFWRPGLAAVLFVASAITFVPSVVAPGQDFPVGTSSVVLVAYVLPLLDVGALLLATWWAERRSDRRHRDIAAAAPSVPHTAGT